MPVTFREEGVDWNVNSSRKYKAETVTFREEGVDWNIKCFTLFVIVYCRGHLPRGRCGLKWQYNPFRRAWCRSPSARKVWIEINVIIQNTQRGMSPSARKVWIEMATLSGTSLINGSPSARKVWIEIPLNKLQGMLDNCHLPRGRCGLKSDVRAAFHTLN